MITLRCFLNRGVIYMEFENLLTLIGNYAFPICCCVYLFWSSAKEREAHKEELAKVTEALQNNTLPRFTASAIQYSWPAHLPQS